MNEYSDLIDKVKKGIEEQMESKAIRDGDMNMAIPVALSSGGAVGGLGGIGLTTHGIITHSAAQIGIGIPLTIGCCAGGIAVLLCKMGLLCNSNKSNEDRTEVENDLEKNRYNSL